MTADELRDLIIAKLARENGGGALRWRKALGEIRVYSLTTHSHCNWEARPSGTARDVAVVERVIDTVRPSHPLVDGPTATG